MNTYSGIEVVTSIPY